MSLTSRSCRVRGLWRTLPTHGQTSSIKLAFHGADTDTDTDTDSPNTVTVLYVRHTLFPREDPREDVRVGVGVV